MEIILSEVKDHEWDSKQRYECVLYLNYEYRPAIVEMENDKLYAHFDFKTTAFRERISCKRFLLPENTLLAILGSYSRV